MLRKPSPRMKPLHEVLVWNVQTVRILGRDSVGTALTDAMMIRGVFERFPTWTQYHPRRPPRSRASVKEGTLYIPELRVSGSMTLRKEGRGSGLPTATEIPPGIHDRQGFPTASVLTKVATTKTAPAPSAHSFAMYGRPWPVTSLAVKIHT